MRSLNHSVQLQSINPKDKSSIQKIHKATISILMNLKITPMLWTTQESSKQKIRLLKILVTQHPNKMCHNLIEKF